MWGWNLSESTMRGNVIKWLRPLDAFAVENRVGVGTPDVNYIEGWIELKWVRRWPKRPETVVDIDHFSKEQRIWLNRRYQRMGNSWLLLQVGREWLLFTGQDAADYVGKLTREGLYKVCRMRLTQGMDKEELIECLTSGN